MPTSVINSRVVLIVRLICHDKKVYEEIIFCKTSQYKSQLPFPSQYNRTFTNRTLSDNQPFCQEEIKPMEFFPSLSFQFHFDQITSRGGGTSICGLYSYVARNRVCFLRFSVLKKGIFFYPFVSVSLVWSLDR